MRKNRNALTKREKEVLGLVGAGYEYLDIAEMLVISPNTVQSYITRILFKTNAFNRTNAVVNALRRKEITLAEIPDSLP